MSIKFYDAADDNGYVAMLATDDEDVLVEFGTWLAQHGVVGDLVWDLDSNMEAVTTHIITDRTIAMLLKLRWGGSHH